MKKTIALGSLVLSMTLHAGTQLLSIEYHEGNYIPDAKTDKTRTWGNLEVTGKAYPPVNMVVPWHQPVTLRATYDFSVHNAMANEIRCTIIKELCAEQNAYCWWARMKYLIAAESTMSVDGDTYSINYDYIQSGDYQPRASLYFGECNGSFWYDRHFYGSLRVV